jgi:hypothetical protein
MNFQLDLKSWSPSQHFEKIIVLCQKGDKISQFDGKVSVNTYIFIIYIQPNRLYMNVIF